MKNALLAVFAVLFLGFLGTSSPLLAAGNDDLGIDGSAQDPAQKLKEAKAECLSCHSAEGLAARKPPASEARRAKMAGLLVDPSRYDQSVHADVACEDCHGDAHKSGVAAAKSCPECHRRQNKTIVPEFANSVHAKANPEAFNCYSCHDPHNVRKASSLGSERNIAHRDNSMCLDCHNSDEKYSKLTNKPRPDLLRTHSWQPNPAMHWAAVRCIDCHTPEKPDGAIAHDIMPKAQAARLCVECHSTSSSLLTRLYRHEVGEQRVSAAGFINAYILTQAYVVGVTRNQYLDWASLILLVALVAGLSGHGLLRYLGYLARKGRK